MGRSELYIFPSSLPSSQFFQDALLRQPHLCRKIGIFKSPVFRSTTVDYYYLTYHEKVHFSNGQQQELPTREMNAKVAITTPDDDSNSISQHDSDTYFK